MTYPRVIGLIAWVALMTATGLAYAQVASTTTDPAASTATAPVAGTTTASVVATTTASTAATTTVSTASTANASTALYYDNEAYIDQVGDWNTANVTQTGEDNEANVYQVGYGEAFATNPVEIFQNGREHMAYVDQAGEEGNSVTITQNGYEQEADVTQSGSFNVAEITQGTDGSDHSENTAVVNQSGEGESWAPNTVMITQFGMEHEAQATQSGEEGNIIDIMQDSGVEQMAVVNQDGSFNMTTVIQN